MIRIKLPHTDNIRYFSLQTIVLLLVFFSAALNFYVFYKGWNLPIIEEGGFRQTQTALTVNWLLKGGNWIAYETPVVGSPWAIPFEFPFYQWIVAVITYISGMEAEQAARVVSYSFFLLCLIPIHSLVKRYDLNKWTYLLIVSFFLSSPIYIFWSR